MTIRTEVPSLPRQPVATRVPLGRVRPAVAALIAVNLAAVTFFLLSYSPHGIGVGPYRIDLDVYRIGSRVWLHGGDLYGLLPRTSSGAQLPFSYPPFAAMVLSPLTLLPMKAASVVCTLGTIALTALALGIFLRSAGVTGRHAVAWLLPAALLLEPVRNTLNYGQVNVALMALVTDDCLVSSPRWPRGALTGIAAAVKLTPAAFVLFFVLRRDRRAALTAVVSFAACTGAGFLFAGRDSADYWTSVLFQSGRPGSPAYAANQSILGVIARAGVDPHSPAGTALWLTLSAAVAVAACRGMRRALAASQPAWALSLNAFAALLICPISWSHHWVWGETAVLTLAVGGRHRDRLRLAAAAVGALLFAAAPQWWFPGAGNRELHWAAWEQVLGNSYVIYAAVILTGAALCGAVSNFPDSPASATYPEIASPAWQARWPTGLGRAGSPGFAVPAAGGCCCRWLSRSPLRARSPGWCSPTRPAPLPGYSTAPRESSWVSCRTVKSGARTPSRSACRRADRGRRCTDIQLGHRAEYRQWPRGRAPGPPHQATGDTYENLSDVYRLAFSPDGELLAILPGQEPAAMGFPATCGPELGTRAPPKRQCGDGP